MGTTGNVSEVRSGQRSYPALDFNRIVHVARRMIRARYDPKYFRVSQGDMPKVSFRDELLGSDFPWSIMPFAPSTLNRSMVLSGTTLTVGEGSFDLMVPGGVCTAAAEDVALTGATAWVFVKIHRVTKVATIHPDSVASRPESTVDEIRIPLFKFESSDGGATYTMTYWALLEPRAGAPKI